ncbi:hypothetical protein [Embleya sp. NPDC005971]|uniref:hypothetical protein n=1 Tax=unclassified Embleya TaxID=2699296 RepID=UPI0033C92BC5
MTRTRFASAGIACVATAFAASAALSGTAHAMVPESRAVTLTCVDSGGTTWATNGPGILASSDSGGTTAQKMKLTAPMTSPVQIPPNALTTTIRTVQTSGAGAGTAWDFAGTLNAPMNVGNPVRLGPVPAPSRLAAGTKVRLVDTSGAAPGAANWSVKIESHLAGVTVFTYCAGGQDSGTDDFTF